MPGNMCKMQNAMTATRWWWGLGGVQHKEGVKSVFFSKTSLLNGEKYSFSL